MNPLPDSNDVALLLTVCRYDNALTTFLNDKPKEESTNTNHNQCTLKKVFCFFCC